MSGFVYIWRDRKTNRYYVGSHWGPDDDGYVCSSKWMRNAYRRRPADFKRRIVARVSTNRQDLFDEEHRWLSMIKPEELGQRYYNMKIWSTGHSRRGERMTDEQRMRISRGQMGHPAYEKQIEATRRSSAREWIVTCPDGSEIEVFNLSAFARENGKLNVANMINVSSRGYRARLKDPTQAGRAKGSRKSEDWKRETSRKTASRWDRTRTRGFHEFLETLGDLGDAEFVIDIGSSRKRTGARESWDRSGGRQYRIHLHEWINKRPIVESMIRNRLGLCDRIGARKTRLIEIDPVHGRRFHDETHISGSGGSSISLGLEDPDGRLVSVMSFARSRYDGYEYELNRFSSLTGITVTGGAGKLFRGFVDRYAPRSVVSFADLRWGRGDVYPLIGFELVKLGPPTYWYFHDDVTNRLSRMNFQKGKLAKRLETFDPSLSELENMLRNGYVRYWDCGSAEYRWSS